jgi:L-alanine-DL-glutamate epimerase-like enolase superfamily enzyme
LLASIPNAAWAEQMGLLDDLWVVPPRIENGVLFAPETPGHGLAFRPEVLADFAQ